MLVAGFEGEAGFDPVLLAALVLGGVLVTHGRQLPDDPCRGVSGGAGAIGDDLGVFVRGELFDLLPVLVPDSAGQVALVVGSLTQHFEQDKVFSDRLGAVLQRMSRGGKQEGCVDLCAKV